MLTAQSNNEIEQLMKHRLLDCVQIRYNCLLLIPEYYQESHLDTVLRLLDYWEENCVTNRVINRTRLLLAIQKGHFNEKIYDGRIIYYLLEYKRQFSAIQANTKEIKNFTSLMDSAHAVFDSFTVQLAEQAYHHSSNNTVEQLLAEHFMGNFDSTFLKLPSIAYNRFDLQRYYWQAVNQVINSPYFFMDYQGAYGCRKVKELKVLGIIPK